MTKYIPNNLRKLRIKAGLRQIDVAVQLGFTSAERISRWEAGLMYPHVNNLFKMAKLYRVPPHELYSELFNSIEPVQVESANSQAS